MPALEGVDSRRLLSLTQEALSNVVRHAEATTVIIRLYPEDNQYILTITDNGRGFDLDDIQPGFRSAYHEGTSAHDGNRNGNYINARQRNDLHDEVPASGDGMSKNLRVLLVEDHQVVRMGLRFALEDVPNVQLVGEAGSADEALLQCRLLQPDVVIMDIKMPKKSGIEACREIVDR